MDRLSKIYIAGHRGMVGSAIVRHLEGAGFDKLIVRTRTELDLCNQAAVRDFFQTEQPDHVVVAAAKVGGIHANNEYPADFIYQNLMMECNIVHESYLSQVKSLLLLGSSCIYPKLASQPMKESALLTGLLEPTNEPYAISKIAGIKLCESYNRQHGVDYRSVMPTNLYGTNDNFHPENSHVIPALIRKFHEAKLSGADSVEVWGTGTAMREFLHVDDMAAACVHVMQLAPEQYKAVTEPMLSHLNVGTSVDVTIKELAETVAEVTGFQGKLVFDSSLPDGAPRKLMDSSKLTSLGWAPKISLKQGLAQTYEWFLANQNSYRH